MKSICTISAVASVIALSGSAMADINPWDFNVFSRSTIGTADASYGSDFQGAAGAVSNAYFSGFALRTFGNASSPSLANAWYGGGSFTMGSGSVNGPIETAGNLSLSSYSVSGNVYSGGSLSGSGGTITGHAYLAGTNTSTTTFNGGGSAHTGVAFSPTVDVNAVSDYFLAASNYAAGLANTNTGAPGATTYANNYGGIVVNLSTTPGINVVSITAADLNSAWGFTVNGDGTLIVNVTGGTANLDSTTWVYTNGASSTRTLLNYNEATTLEMNGGNIVNILAPNAAVHYSSGHVDGSLIVGSLTGSGQVNWVGSPPSFNTLIPAPSAAGVLALGGLAAMRRRRRA